MAEEREAKKRKMATPLSIHPDIANFVDYIDPNYASTTRVNVADIRKEFNNFSNSLLRGAIGGEDPTIRPSNPYTYNAHMGQFIRYFDAAKVRVYCKYFEQTKDEYVKALLAFYAKKEQPPSEELA